MRDAPDVLSGPLPVIDAPGAAYPRRLTRLQYRSAPPDRPAVRFGFYAIVAAVFAALVGGMALFVIRWDHPTSVALFAILSVLFAGSAYGLARQIIALVVRPSDLPSVALLDRRPRVAILYTTMNDVVPECLRAIHQDYPVDVFVLDDSSDPQARASVDEISAARGYSVVRRPARRGFKAGAINDWYSAHGRSYDYFVLLDSDSFLPADWVREALGYAEHPANGRVAIFQGLINIWNFDTRFVQSLAPMARVGQFVWEERLANALDTVFCYGHNALIRVAAVEEIGGFVEGYVSEDFATAVALADRDWHSRFIPLHTYEAMPENVRGFVKRQNKWTRGAMEFLSFARRSRLPWTRKFHLLQTPIGHFTNLLLPVGMLLTVYGFSSSWAGAAQFLGTFAGDPLGTFWSIPLFRYLLVVGLLGTIPTLLVHLRCRIGFGTYWRHRFLSAAVSAIALPYEAVSMASYLSRRIRQIPVTPKGEAPLRPRDVLYLARYSVVLESVLMAGLVVFNPAGAFFNASWLVPMVLAPWVILRFSGGPRLAEGPRSVPVGAQDVGSREPQAFVVHASLSQIRSTGRIPRRWAAV